MKPKPKNEETMSTIVSSFTQEFIEEYDLEQQFSTWQTEIKNHPYYLKFFNKYQQIANDDPLIKV